jgi:hypothetical protein
MTYGEGLHIRDLTASPRNNKLTPSDAKPLRLRIRDKGDLRKFTNFIWKLMRDIEGTHGVSMGYR